MKPLILIKLVSNQEIVAELTSSVVDHGIKIGKPRFIAYESDGKGNFQASLIPYSPIHPDGDYYIYNTSIMSTCSTALPNILTEMYASHTTGLDLQTGLSK